MADNDAQLHLKKRSRRRLVGAVFFASVVAVVLPMVMDHEPRQAVQDVEIRIPGQDEKPLAPKFAVAPVDKAPEAPAEKPAPVPPVAQPEAKPTARVLEVVRDGETIEKAPQKPAEKPAAKPEAKPEKAPEKAPAKPVDKAADKSTEKPVDKAADKPRSDDAKRAAAILAGQPAEAKPAAAGGEYLILIGAFSNEANVRTLKAKLSEEGIRNFTEPLDTPQGKKTRVRAGPFASREAAEKALQKMQRIGVSGVLAAKP